MSPRFNAAIGLVAEQPSFAWTDWIVPSPGHVVWTGPEVCKAVDSSRESHAQDSRGNYLHEQYLHKTSFTHAQIAQLTLRQEAELVNRYLGCWAYDCSFRACQRASAFCRMASSTKTKSRFGAVGINPSFG